VEAGGRKWIQIGVGYCDADEGQEQKGNVNYNETEALKWCIKEKKATCSLQLTKKNGNVTVKEVRGYGGHVSDCGDRKEPVKNSDTHWVMWKLKDGTIAIKWAMLDSLSRAAH